MKDVACHPHFAAWRLQRLPWAGLTLSLALLLLLLSSSSSSSNSIRSSQSCQSLIFIPTRPLLTWRRATGRRLLTQRTEGCGLLHGRKSVTKRRWGQEEVAGGDVIEGLPRVCRREAYSARCSRRSTYHGAGQQRRLLWPSQQLLPWASQQHPGRRDSGSHSTLCSRSCPLPRPRRCCSFRPAPTWARCSVEGLLPLATSQALP